MKLSQEDIDIIFTYEIERLKEVLVAIEKKDIVITKPCLICKIVKGYTTTNDIFEACSICNAIGIKKRCREYTKQILRATNRFVVWSENKDTEFDKINIYVSSAIVMIEQNIVEINNQMRKKNNE